MFVEKLFWEKEYTITTNSLDCYDRLSLMGILDLLQDAAGYHAALLGLGFVDLKAKGITWLLVRTKFMIMKSLPMTRKVKVKTWQSYKGRVDYERDYLVCDENDEVLIKGTSKWCLIDINTHKIVPTARIDLDITYPEKRNYEKRFEKLKFSLESAVEQQSFIVYNSHLDHNFHVNNTKYGEFITNAIHLSYEDNIKQFEINYIKEVHLNDELIVKFDKRDNQYFIEGYCNNELAVRSFLEVEKN